MKYKITIEQFYYIPDDYEGVNKVISDTQEMETNELKEVLEKCIYFVDDYEYVEITGNTDYDLTLESDMNNQDFRKTEFFNTKRHKLIIS